MLTWCRLAALVLAGLPAAAARPDGPTLWVLSVGCASHQDPSHNLRFAGSDARAVAMMLDVRGRGPFDRVRSLVLTGRRAVAPKILAAAAALRELARPDDTVLFFYSGHGGVDPKHGFQFVTWEADDERPESFLRWRDLAQELNRLPAGRLIVAIDACEAGGVLVPEPTTQRTALQPRGSLAVLASSRRGEDSLELPERRHGAFTIALLEALAGHGADGDGQVTLGGLDRYLQRRVQVLTKGEQRTWPLKLRGEKADTVVAELAPG